MSRSHEDEPKTLLELLDMLDQNRTEEVEACLRAFDQKLPDQIARIVAQARKLIQDQKPNKLKAYFVKKETPILLKEKALLNLGLSLLKIGQSSEASLLFDEILAFKPDCALGLAYRGKILTDVERLQEAGEVIDKALTLDPLLPRGWFYKGNLFFGQQHFEEAIRCYQKACDLDPRFGEAWANRGYASVRLTFYHDALVSYDKACALMPEAADVWADHGSVLLALERYEEALISYNKALAINSHYIAVLFNKGAVLVVLKHYEEASVCYKNAITLKPDYAEAWVAYGHVLSTLKRSEDCLEAYDKALALGYETPELWSQRGTHLFYLNRYQESLAAHDKALALSPDNPEFWLDRGTTLSGMFLHPEALVCYEKALEIRPEDRNALFYIGLMHLRLNRPHIALDVFHKTLLIKPEDPEVLWNASIAHMFLRNYKRGWELYEYRWRCEGHDTPRHQQIPVLADKNVAQGKKVLVWYEQGFGDTLQFMRYIPLFEQLGADVTFEVQGPLHSLLRRCFPNVKVVSSQPVLSESFEYQIPLLSLPHFLKTELALLPDIFKNLAASPQRQEQWSHMIVDTAKLNIGIVCSGSAGHKKSGVNRSVPLETFLPLSRVANLYLIQKDVRESDREVVENSDIFFLGETIQDFEDVAAIMHHLDLIISVDTASAHLAASMGKTIWVLLHWNPDWRWLLEAETSPWYPETRLFRQPQPGDWTSVLQDVAKALEHYPKPAQNGS